MNFPEESSKQGLSFLSLNCDVHQSYLITNCGVFWWGRKCKRFRLESRLRKFREKMSYGVLPTFLAMPNHLGKICQIGCGAEHGVALTTEFELIVWGNNSYGQLGNPELTGRNVFPPTKLVPFGLESVQTISCGHYHSLALTTTGKVYAWGWNVHGQLGVYSRTDDVRTPRLVDFFGDARRDLVVQQIACGYAHSLFLTLGGKVFSCGNNTFDQLGVDDASSRSQQVQKRCEPGLVSAVPVACDRIAAGHFHNVAYSSKDRRLFQWGVSLKIRQLARISTRRHLQTGVRPRPNFVQELKPTVTEVDIKHIEEPVIQIACGHNHSCLLTSAGLVYVWGENYDYQLGFDDRVARTKPSLLEFSQASPISFIACCSETTLCLDKNSNTIYGWGCNDLSQLGCKPNRQNSDVKSGDQKFEHKKRFQIQLRNKDNTKMERIFVARKDASCYVRIPTKVITVDSITVGDQCCLFD